jgi:hypothetical protein
LVQIIKYQILPRSHNITFIYAISTTRTTCILLNKEITSDLSLLRLWLCRAFTFESPFAKVSTGLGHGYRVLPALQVVLVCITPRD